MDKNFSQHTGPKPTEEQGRVHLSTMLADKPEELFLKLMGK